MRVLIVGGAGYIGSHVCKALAARGDEPVVFDNLSRGHDHAVQWGPLVRGDIRNAEELDAAFQAHQPAAVMHFAANIEVGEGQKEPLAFWDNNVAGVVSLLQAMKRAGCSSLVFSSTCATYGTPQSLPLTEDEPQTPINVYGRTKLAVEQLLADVSSAEDLRYAALRYFNASGASPDGEIGEEHDPETHLIPNALKAAAGLGGPMKLFGTDYDTADGTCERDFIHVMDLAEGHIAALERISRTPGLTTVNLGTGTGYSVMELVSAFEAASGRKIPYRIAARRPGDAASSYADVRQAEAQLGWKAKRSLDDMCRDTWLWQQTSAAAKG